MAGFRVGRHADGGERESRISEWAHASRAVGIEEDGIAHASDDERSIAADSWSVKSEYGSTLDGDDTRHAEVDVLETVNASSDEEGKDDEDEEGSVLGLRSHWDATYAHELNNFQEHGQPGEIWFGESVMETVADWVARIAKAASAEPSRIIDSNGSISHPRSSALQSAAPSSSSQSSFEACSSSFSRTLEPQIASLSVSDSSPVSSLGNASNWKVLDLGTGNGLFLHSLSKRGFSHLWGSDYCETAIELAKSVAQKANLSHINFLVDDMLDTKIQMKFEIVTDKGTYDAICLHPEGPVYKKLYKLAVEKLVSPGGILIVTSCNKTKDELISELTTSDGPSSRNEAFASSAQGSSNAYSEPVFSALDFIRTYPTYRFGGVEGARVCTVAFKRKL